MGMTDGQLLRRVELPLAASVILAGIRVATVIGVGLATIAAPIGAGGLGTLVFSGVASLDNAHPRGAIPAAAAGARADALLGAVERRVPVAAMTRRVRSARSRSCRRGVRARRRVVVGSKNFTEQRILGELVAQTARRPAAGRRRFDLGGTFVCDAALAPGRSTSTSSTRARRSRRS
jgi:osmoprotectant transport system permease protein